MSHARDILTSSSANNSNLNVEPSPLFLSPTAIPLVMDFLEYLYAAIAAVFPLLSGLRENLLHEWTRTLGLVSSTVSRFSIQAGDSGLSLPSATATLDPVTYDLDILDLPPTSIDAYNLPQVDYPTEYHPIFTAVRQVYSAWIPKPPSLPSIGKYPLVVYFSVFIFTACYALWTRCRSVPVTKSRPKALNPLPSGPSQAIPISSHTSDMPLYMTPEVPDFPEVVFTNLPPSSLDLVLRNRHLSLHLLDAPTVKTVDTSAELDFSMPPLLSAIQDPSEQLVDVGNSVQDDVKIGPAQMNAPVSVGCLLERNEEMALPEVPYGISRTVLSEAPLLLSAMNRDIPNPFNVSVGSFPDVSFLACLSDLTTETTTPTAGLDPTEDPYRADLGSSLDGPTACKPAMDTYESCAAQLVDTSLPNDEKIPGLVPPEPEYEKTCVTDLACSEDYNVNDIEHILSPRAAEDTEDFEAYEPPSSFPFMHFNNDLGDLLGEDLDDWNWTLVNLQLSQRRSFVCGVSNQSAHAQPSEYATANKPNILDGVFPRDLPPRVKIPGLRRVRSEPSFASIRYISRDDIDPLPHLDQPELVACYPFVATRVGIIHHDESFRMYEPPVQLELAVREERRATLLAIQHKKLKKNKSTPNLQRVGLSREAFFAIFLRQSIPRMTLSYADAVRIGLVKQRARMITAPTTDSAKTDPSWARVPNRLVVLNRNRNGQDKNINGDNQIVSRQPHRRASFSGSSNAGGSRARTLTGPVSGNPMLGGQTQPFQRAASEHLIIQPVVRPRARAGSFQSNAAYTVPSHRPPMSSGVASNILHPASASPCRPNARLGKRRESSPCVSRPPVLETIVGSPSHSPIPAPVCGNIIRAGSPPPLSLDARVAKARNAYGPMAVMALPRIDDEDALADVPAKIVDGKALREDEVMVSQMVAWTTVGL